ncbi:MAG: SocA family protein [Clostridia bacterium]|nr:SocA family protein [Clostridia bacterium]
MNKLNCLISYFIRNAAYNLNKTEIVKMCYMFEYYHVQTYGKQYSGAIFIRYNYGPYTQEIDRSIDFFTSIGAVEKYECEYDQDRKVYYHSCANKDILGLYSLEREKEYIADRVLKELCGLSYDTLISKVYSTPPMERILEEERISYSKMYGRELNMYENKNIKKFSKEELREARQRRTAEQDRGTDEEYYCHLNEQYHLYDDLRRRANAASNN